MSEVLAAPRPASPCQRCDCTPCHNLPFSKKLSLSLLLKLTEELLWQGDAKPYVTYLMETTRAKPIHSATEEEKQISVRERSQL